MDENKKRSPLNIILRKLWASGVFTAPDPDIMETVLDWRQKENLDIASAPCPHGSKSGTKLDCPECFETHFFNRAVRN